MARTPTRKPNAERRTETRANLLAAASTVVARRGYHSASVDEIAAEAGYSPGAVYAHFAGKEDLFLELVGEHLDRQIERYTDASIDARNARAGADEWIEYLDREPEYFQVFISFWDYATRNDALRPLLAERLAQLREVSARLIIAGAEAQGLKLAPGVADRLALFVTALGNGIALQRQADPSSVPDDFFGTTLVQVFGALAAGSSQQESGRKG
jgi:AcrR family transcriptional regulator